MPGIVVGVDGSGHSQRALEWAAREAALRQVPLTVITVRQPAMGWRGIVSLPGDRPATEQLRQNVKAETDEILEQIGDRRPPEVSVEAINGTPAEALLGAADEADLLVVGSRGAGGFTRLLLGSVSTHVTHHARCAVVVIPPAGHD